MGSTPLRRSERGKNPVDVHASNVKSTKKSGDISKEIAEEGSRDSNGEKSEKIGSTPLRRSENGKNPVDVPASNVKSIEKSVVTEEGSRDSNGGSKKRKRYDAGEFKSRKSPRFQKQMGPTTRSAVKKKPEKSEKIGLTPLRRSERGKNPVGQMVVNDEISLNGPAHETQIVDLMESGKEDQESREMSINQYGEAPAKQDANTWNDVKWLKHNDIPAIEEIASEQQDEVENVVSGDDAIVSSERIGDISAKHDTYIDMAPNDYSADMSHAVEDPNKNGSNDISLHADSDQMGIPAANDLTPHIKYADGSHVVEDLNGTRPNHVAPNVRSVELGIPAGNCNQEKAEDTTPSVQQVASPVSDHSMPQFGGLCTEIHNDSHLLQQPTEDRIQDQEGQADHTPMVETKMKYAKMYEAKQVDRTFQKSHHSILTMNHL
ncbi:hypothetical protein Tco_0659349 [Tanacetum coccineum]